MFKFGHLEFDSALHQVAWTVVNPWKVYVACLATLLGDVCIVRPTGWRVWKLPSRKKIWAAYQLVLKDIIS